MALITLDDLKQSSGALMGVDPGTKTFGLAISDRTRLIATPLETIRREKFSLDAAHLLSLYDENDVSALIVGLPVNMDGSHGPRAQCLSTMAVTRTMLEGDLSRKKRAQHVDKLAAGYILQGVLDRLRA